MHGNNRFKITWSRISTRIAVHVIYVYGAHTVVSLENLENYKYFVLWLWETSPHCTAYWHWSVCNNFDGYFEFNIVLWLWIFYVGSSFSVTRFKCRSKTKTQENEPIIANKGWQKFTVHSVCETWCGCDTTTKQLKLK